jgi:DNA polymerase-4
VRKIIHCDADCFFAAIEMRDDPSLRSRPIAVGGASDRRGVISKCNYEARKFGVHSAMSSFMAKRSCPELLILPHRMEVYRETSSRIQQIFYQFSELVEPLSLDEAYLDVTQSGLCGGSATRIAEDIRARVFAECGITVSAGVAPNKFLAKVASDWNKPNGIFVVAPKNVESFVEKLPVHKIPGVGKATAAQLESFGVTTCAELQQYSLSVLLRRFGVMGVRLYEYCRGIDLREVKPSQRRKSLSVEHTFEQDLSLLEYCLRQLPDLLSQLSIRLSACDDDYVVVKIFIKMKFSDFTSTTVESMGAGLLLREFEGLCRTAYARKVMPVRLLGVGVRFVDTSSSPRFQQLALFG